MNSMYLDQVGLKIQTPLGMRHCRIPGNCNGAYAVMWSQNIPHQNCRMKPESDAKALPIVQQRAAKEDDTAKILWEDYGGVLLWSLDVCDSDVERLRQKFTQDVKQLGKQIGPWAKGGMRTGGGLPWGSFALAAESLPELWRAYQTTSRIAGHHFDVPRIPAFGAVLATKKSDHFTGLQLHRDNNKVKGAPEVACLNCAFVLWPPAEGYLRTSIILNWVPATQKHLHQLLVAALSRSSQTEDGAVRKGPFEMPSPAIALGSKNKHERPGQIPTIQAADRLTNNELMQNIRSHCQSYIVERMQTAFDTASRTADMKKAKGTFEDLLEDRYPCIRSVAHLKMIRKGSRWSGERELLARCRKFNKTELYDNFTKPMMVVFLRVQRYMYEQFDIMHLHDWVHNQNQYRRKRKAVKTQKTQQKKLKH